MPLAVIQDRTAERAPRAKISVEPHLVIVSHRNDVLGASYCVLWLDHPRAERLLYLPRADVLCSMLRPSGRRETCPLRGEIRYYDAHAGGVVVEDAAIAVERPSAACRRLGGHIAFDPRRIDGLEVVQTGGYAYA